jgi:hypothetical protein
LLLNERWLTDVAEPHLRKDPVEVRIPALLAIVRQIAAPQAAAAATLADPGRVLPRLPEFRAVCRRVDPRGALPNRYVARVVGFDFPIRADAVTVGHASDNQFE